MKQEAVVMKTIRHPIVLALSIVVAIAGCSFRPFIRESRDPASTALPPCFTGDVCAMAFDGAGVAWTADVMQSVRR
jgi:hypothetical protein